MKFQTLFKCNNYLINIKYILGRFEFRSEDVKDSLLNNNCIPITFVDDQNMSTENYPMNPNGSFGKWYNSCVIVNYIKSAPAFVVSVYLISNIATLHNFNY